MRALNQFSYFFLAFLLLKLASGVEDRPEPNSIARAAAHASGRGQGRSPSELGLVYSGKRFSRPIELVAREFETDDRQTPRAKRASRTTTTAEPGTAAVTGEYVSTNDGSYSSNAPSTTTRKRGPTPRPPSTKGSPKTTTTEMTTTVKRQRKSTTFGTSAKPTTTARRTTTMATTTTSESSDNECVEDDETLRGLSNLTLTLDRYVKELALTRGTPSQVPILSRVLEQFPSILESVVDMIETVMF